MKNTYAVRRFYGAGVAMLAILGVAGPVHGAAGDTERISGEYTAPAAISGDGRIVVFADYSDARMPRLCVRDRLRGVTQRFAFDGRDVSITPDGRYIAFISDAKGGAFVLDRATQVIQQVNVGLNGDPRDEYIGPFQTSISDDGRYVAFIGGLWKGGADGVIDPPDVFVKDRQTSAVEAVYVSPPGSPAEPAYIAMSGNGRYVAFQTRRIWDSPAIYVRDRLNARTVLVIPAADGAHYLRDISADGRYIAFTSDASNLVPNDTNGTTDVFVRDRQLGLTERVSVASDGTQADGRSHGASTSLSADGRYVAFESEASNLIAGNTMQGGFVYVRDRQTGQNEIGSASGGEPLGGSSPSLSADGRHLLFSAGGVYVHELGSMGTPITSYAAEPSALVFGNQALYTSTRLRLWFVNKGTISVQVASVGVVGLNPGMFLVDNRCSWLLPGASCATYITFRPTSVGVKSAKLQYVIADGNTHTRSLTGTGVRSMFIVTPTARDFGNVRINTTTAARIVTISNTGSAVLPVSSITIGGWNPYQFAQTHNCPANLAVGANCTINVVFKPTTPPGSKAALLNITPGGGAAIRSVALAGAASR